MLYQEIQDHYHHDDSNSSSILLNNDHDDEMTAESYDDDDDDDECHDDGMEFDSADVNDDDDQDCPFMNDENFSSSSFSHDRVDHDGEKEEPGSFLNGQESPFSTIETILHNSTGTSDCYSYFDPKLLQNWAGPAYWKKVGARKPKELPLGKRDASAEDDPATKSSITVKKKKEQQLLISFDFPEAPADEPAQRRTADQISKLHWSDAIVKKMKLESDASLLLPPDHQYTLHQLSSLFMKPHIKISTGARPCATTCHGTSNDFDDHQSLDEPQDGQDPSLCFEMNDDDDDDDDDAAAEVCDDPFIGEDGNENQSSMMMIPNDQGLSFNNNNASAHRDWNDVELLHVSRKVNKIDVKYETIAKRVDVKKLKSSIWDEVGKNDTQEREETLTPKDKDVDLTFDHMVSNVAQKVRSIQSNSMISRSDVHSFGSDLCRFPRMSRFPFTLFACCIWQMKKDSSSWVKRIYKILRFAALPMIRPHHHR